MTETMTTGTWNVWADRTGDDDYDLHVATCATEADARAYSAAYSAAKSVGCMVDQMLSAKPVFQTELSSQSVEQPVIAAPAVASAPATTAPVVTVAADPWTRPVTSQRMLALNKLATKAEYKNADGKFNFAKLEAALGFSLKDLQAARKRHGL